MASMRFPCSDLSGVRQPYSFVLFLYVQSLCGRCLHYHGFCYFAMFLSLCPIMSLVLSSSHLSYVDVCVCSSGAARWPAAESQLETGRLAAGFLLQGEGGFAPHTAQWPWNEYLFYSLTNFVFEWGFVLCSYNMWPVEVASGSHSALRAVDTAAPYLLTWGLYHQNNNRADAHKKGGAHITDCIRI